MSETNYIPVEKLRIVGIEHPTCERIVFQKPSDAGNDWHYQLFCNGRWIDVTDTPTQRWFDVHRENFLQQYAVIAVAPQDRTLDFTSQLTEEVRNPGWVFKTSVLRNSDYLPGDVISIYHDDATGEILSEPAVEIKIYPPAVSHSGWGVSSLEIGGFGIDGAGSPGITGSFGAGPMGLDADFAEISVALSSPGTHRIVAKITSENLVESEPYETTFICSIPPTRAGEISLAGYVPATQQVTISFDDNGENDE